MAEVIFTVLLEMNVVDIGLYQVLLLHQMIGLRLTRKFQKNTGVNKIEASVNFRNDE